MGNNNIPLRAHLSIFSAEIIWGLMAPLGKDAINHGISGFSMVSFRVWGAAVLFWVLSLFTKQEHVERRDILLLSAAALLGIVFNQCLYIVGLSYTSPVNSSIVTTSMPIFAMILSFLILKEPITWQKAGGVLIGCAGAVTLILTSAKASSAEVGDIRGDLMCMGAQFSFALYLALFSKLIKRYSVVTINKWMFLWAAIIIMPFTSSHVASIDWVNISIKTWSEAGFVVVFGTFISYLLAVSGQHILRPTVVSVYNYVQPVVAISVSLATGLAIFTWLQGVAVFLIFSGVSLVIKSKSKRDLQKSTACESHDKRFKM